MNTQKLPQAQTEQNQTPALTDLQHPFAGLCFAYGSIFSDTLSHGDLLYRLTWLLDDAEKIAEIAKALRTNFLDGTAKPKA